jgi:type 1 glutamine amidotransferase
LLRYVREGGGLAGLHATSYASPDIPEFGELIGAQDGPHKVETVTLKIDDPASPLTKPFIGSELTKPFGGTGFTYTDEFYHFLPTGPYSREKLHVLTSIDTDKSDMSTWHVRPDNDYATSWIKSYGKGRVFNCSMGHTPTFFQTPELAAFLLSGIQFVLGDLPADTTPSAKLAAKTTAAK